MPWNMCGSQVLPGMLGRSSTSTSGRWWHRGRCSWRPAAKTTSSLWPPRQKTVAELRQVYEALGGRPEALVHDAFDGGHQWHGELAYPFLDHWLGKQRLAATT